jgi:hypothetical protein
MLVQMSHPPRTAASARAMVNRIRERMGRCYIARAAPIP